VVKETSNWVCADSVGVVRGTAERLGGHQPAGAGVDRLAQERVVDLAVEFAQAEGDRLQRRKFQEGETERFLKDECAGECAE
jgi:hypothetical protein